MSQKAQIILVYDRKGGSVLPGATVETGRNGHGRMFTGNESVLFRLWWWLHRRVHLSELPLHTLSDFI